jgi:Nucleotide modification associated domain 3
LLIIFSRKGFDTGSGGAASPIIDSRPVSLPIPTSRRSATTYDNLGLGEIVEQITRGKIDRKHLCHEDPMFINGECLFGQCGAAQSHLRNMGVGVGDVFLFFGLFAEENTGERHHRIFGFLKVEEIVFPVTNDLGLLDRPHPHTLGEWNNNNTVYRGKGMVANGADEALRLTQPNGPLTHWIVPTWLEAAGLSFHRKSERWFDNNRLAIVSRGQEFVTDISDNLIARDWLEETLRTIQR